MNKSVPTLLGIVIILLVVVLVVLIYDYKMTSEIVAGGVAVQTTGGRALTGVDAGGEQISPSEVLGTAPRPAAALMPPAEERGPKGLRRPDVAKQIESGVPGVSEAPKASEGD